MTYFRRVLKYISAQKKALVILFICAFLAAALTALTIVSALPIIKVILNEEGTRGWIARTIIKDRMGIEFQPVPIAENISTLPDPCAPKLPLQINGLKDPKKFGTADLLQKQDLVLALQLPDSPQSIADRHAMLEHLAFAPPNQPITLTITTVIVENQRVSQTPPRQVAITPQPMPFYAPAATWLYQKMPAQQNNNMKRQTVLFMLPIILIASILGCVFRFCQQYLAHRVAYKVIMGIRLEAYGSAIRLPMSFYSEKGIADSMSRFLQDCNQILTGVSTLLGKVIIEPLKIISFAFFAMAMNSKVTLVLMIGVPLAAVIFSKLGQKMKRATRRTLESRSQMLARLQDTLLGVRVVKGYHREQYEQQRLQEIHEKLLRQQYRMGKINAAGGPLLGALGTAVACGVLFLAVDWLFSGQMKFSQFIVIGALLGSLAESARKMGDVWPRLQTANAAAQRVYELVDTPIEKDPPQAVTISPLKESVEFRNITFTYPNADTPALADINITVKAGQRIAVVGPNGSGKSTLLNLIPRFYTPQQGTIFLDGIDIANASIASLRQQIGIVTQQTIVFHDTIAANIAYSDPTADREKVIQAAKQAFAHDFIMNTPHGYDTVIGEQGATLSGGQLQRLAIARAILRDPAIVIFDEATSQIDSDSEAKIQTALAEFSKDRTSFIIAHRLTTVIDSDLILVLDFGRLVSVGTHQELLDKCDLYRNLYNRQFG